MLARALHVFMASVIVGACQQQVAIEDILATAFVEAAFNEANTNDLALADATGDGLTRWETEIFYEIGGTASPQEMNAINEELRRFSTLTGVRSSRDPNRESNLRFTVAPDWDFSSIGLPFAECAAQVNANDGQIASAYIVIGNVRKEGLRGCVRHELMHAFGFVGHTHRLTSILSYFHGEADLTDIDVVFLKVLYGEGFRAGMAQQEVRSSLDLIFRRHMPVFGK